MTINTLCQVATACLMILVSSVICGRVPVGISRVNFIEEENVKPFKSSEEYVDLDNLHNSDDDTDTAVYITDVQISELQNAREKISQDQEVYHVDPRCPAFNGFCNTNTPTCFSDRDCGNKICCYNGCANTCVEDKSPSIAIDWIPVGEEKVALLSNRTKDTITIPGGCNVNSKQQKSLEMFIKYGHVTKCECKNKDVVCLVRKRSPSMSSSRSTDSDEYPSKVDA